MNFEQRLPPGRRVFLAAAGLAVSAAPLIAHRVLAAQQAVSLPPEILHPPVCALAELGPPPPIPAGPPRKA